MRGKGQKPYELTDFMIEYGKERQAAKPEDLLAKVVMINAMFGGKDERAR